MKKTILLLLILLVVFSSILGTTNMSFAATTMTTPMKVVKTEHLNVRAATNTTSEILGFLRPGDTVEVVKSNAKWAKLSTTTLVRNPNSTKSEYIKLTKTGYCSMDYLKAMEMKEYTSYITLVSTKVYTSTSTSSKVLQTFKTNTPVKAVSSTKAWIKLSSGGYCLLKPLGQNMMVYGANQVLNLRSTPDNTSDSNIIGQIPNGTYVTVKSTSHGWSNVKVLLNGNQLEGYCSRKYLKTSEELISNEEENDYKPTSNSDSTPAPVNVYPNQSSTPHFTTTDVFVRTGPDTSYPLKQQDTIKAFSIIDVVDYTPNGWFVTADNGYIRGDNVAKNISKININLEKLPNSYGTITLTCSNGKQLSFACSGGMAGYNTPIGTYQVLLKAEKVRSTLYPPADNSYNMMYSLYFKIDPDNGFAIHSGGTRDLSHGCIHVEDSVQKKIFQFTEVGCPITITQKGR